MKVWTLFVVKQLVQHMGGHALVECPQIRVRAGRSRAQPPEYTRLYIWRGDVGCDRFELGTSLVEGREQIGQGGNRLSSYRLLLDCIVGG